MSVKKRLKEIERNISGFKDEQDRQQSIRYLKSIDPDINPADIESFEDYMNEIKSFFAPIPGTPQYDEWLGTEMHAKYERRQKKKEENANIQ